MAKLDPYNPLDLEALGHSLLRHMEQQPLLPLQEVGKFEGSGVYALYYCGAGDPYGAIGRFNRSTACRLPIYVGRAKDPGSRTGFDPLETVSAPLLWSRVNEHRKSIESTADLDSAEFKVRVLVVMPIWIPLAETMAIRQYRPLWNSRLQGFGIHAPGSGRSGQKRSPWDELHPGRGFAAGLKRNVSTTRTILLERMRSAAQEAVDAASFDPPPPAPPGQSGQPPAPASRERHSRADASPRSKRR